ncbi:MAG: permease-like cell division protein FtsX [Oscillospiraceae bacterium]|nr:permease-like cell division protein FtsX [Oscillospiraceae bacterium]MCR4760213.1 permease-like cell division protein FtsX [Oscillospiraceae bacterium]
MKLSSFRYLVRQGFDNVWKNRVMAFASFCVLLVSLLLVGISILFYININVIIGGIENRNEAIIYLNYETPQSRIDEIGETLRTIDNVSSVKLYTGDEALDDYKNKMDDFTDVFESLENEEDILPDAYLIHVADISKMSKTLKAVQEIPDVLNVRSPDAFIELLTEARRVVTIVASAIIIALLIVSMVIISNTTRASVFSRRREISIMQSVGATKNFIRFPFFIEGMINGFMAGVFATLLTWFTYNSLVKLIGRFEVLNVIGLGNVIPYRKIGPIVTLSYVLLGSLIGAIGSVLSTRVHLKYRAANM